MAFPWLSKFKTHNASRAGSLAKSNLTAGNFDTRLESRPTPWFPLIVGGAMAALVVV